MSLRNIIIAFATLCAAFQIQADETPKTYRVPQFENEHVRVWRTVIMPHQPLKLHRHDCARVVVGLKGGSLTKIEETGELSELRFDTGCAYWLSDDPPGKLHSDVNETDEPIEVMIIELKALDKAPQATTN